MTVEAKRSEYQDISLERALKTFDNAVTQQHDLSSKRGAVQKAVTYTPDRVQRFVDRVNGGATPKRDSNLLKAIDSGMNNDEFQGIMAEIAHAFMQEGGEPKRNFSQMVEDRMKGNAAKASKDIPPLP